MKLDYLRDELDVSDDTQSIEIFRCIRWANGVYCPECKSFDIIMAGGGGSEKRLIDTFAKIVTFISTILQVQYFTKARSP